jgi:hypothetical protein
MNASGGNSSARAAARIVPLGAEREEVKVRAEAEAAIETLDEGHAAGLPPALTALVPVVPLQLGVQHAQYPFAQVVVVAHAVAQPVRHGQHPLAHRHVRDHVFDEMRRCFCHTLAAAPRAESTALARERDHLILAAAAAVQANQPAREHAAVEKRAQLLLHEAWHSGGAIVELSGGLEEGREVLLDHAVQHTSLGLPALVSTSRRRVRVRAWLGSEHGQRDRGRSPRATSSRDCSRTVRPDDVWRYAVDR